MYNVSLNSMNTISEWITGCKCELDNEQNPIVYFDNINTAQRYRDTILYFPKLIVLARVGQTISITVEINSFYGFGQEQTYCVNYGDGIIEIGKTNIEPTIDNTQYIKQSNFKYTIPNGIRSNNYAIYIINNRIGRTNYKCINVYSLQIY